MTEPYYDEDLVNLAFLRKKLGQTDETIEKATQNISRHYGSQPMPPYNVGDTWSDGSTIYTCIHSRLVGNYVAEDWTTESGALDIATNKSKVFLRQPTNYQMGDMWLLQTDTDHPLGKKGEILIANKNGKEYKEEDWVKELTYVTREEKTEIDKKLETATNNIAELKTTSTNITARVQETEVRLNDTYTKEDIEAMNGELADDLEIVSQRVGTLEITSTSIKARVESVETEVVENISYNVSIESSNGTVFKNGDIETTLRAVVRKGNTDITDSFTDTQFSWERISDDSVGDLAWNKSHTHTKSVVVTSDDIKVRATFNVVLHIS